MCLSMSMHAFWCVCRVCPCVSVLACFLDYLPRQDVNSTFHGVHFFSSQLFTSFVILVILNKSKQYVPIHNFDQKRDKRQTFSR